LGAAREFDETIFDLDQEGDRHFLLLFVGESSITMGDLR
jgi:hypothetical protein